MLFALPDRLALLQKRSDSFLKSGVQRNARVLQDGAFQIVVHSAAAEETRRCLERREAAWACRDQQVRKFVRALHQFVCRNNL